LKISETYRDVSVTLALQKNGRDELHLHQEGIRDASYRFWKSPFQLYDEGRQ
jgi:hypothetical protein